MIRRPFGNTGIYVSALGLGAGHIGSPQMTEDHAGTLTNRAIDRGINFIDTAREYGLSEEHIGRHLSWRRHDCVLGSKGGFSSETSSSPIEVPWQMTSLREFKRHFKITVVTGSDRFDSGRKLGFFSLGKIVRSKAFAHGVLANATSARLITYFCNLNYT